MSDNTQTPNRHTFNIKNLLPGLGFLLISMTVALFCVITMIRIWHLDFLGSILIGLVLTGLIAALLNQAPNYHFNAHQLLDIKSAGVSIIIHAVSAFITYYMSHELHFGPVLASALVGLIGGLILPQLGPEFYCGSFVGMCSTYILTSYSDTLFAAALAGLIFHFSRHILNGFGGKLGTIAFCGDVLVLLISGREIPHIPDQALEFSWTIILVAVVSTALTYYLHNHNNFSPVVASSMVGLLGGFLFPLLIPGQGEILAVVSYCASFTGMSNKMRLPTILKVVAAGLFTGIIFHFSSPFFVGLGGKLGTIALGSTLAVWGFSEL